MAVIALVLMGHGSVLSATSLDVLGGCHSRARSRGVRGTSELPSTPEENLIFRAMQRTGEREGFELPRVRLAVQNEIPVAGGLGSSAAATVAGIALGFAVAGRTITKDRHDTDRL